MAPKVQQPAPHFKATALVGEDFKEISLDDYKGKYVVSISVFQTTKLSLLEVVGNLTVFFG
jgi:alkyl hydroperoxide reductase subunit AhpC